jgi:hypothetical protein
MGPGSGGYLVMKTKQGIHRTNFGLCYICGTGKGMWSKSRCCFDGTCFKCAGRIDSFTRCCPDCWKTLRDTQNLPCLTCSYDDVCFFKNAPNYNDTYLRVLMDSVHDLQRRFG